MMCSLYVYVILIYKYVCCREDDGDNVFRRSTVQAEKQALQDMLLSGPYSRSQIYLSETLARLHPDNTMPMFSGQ